MFLFARSGQKALSLAPRGHGAGGQLDERGVKARRILLRQQDADAHRRAEVRALHRAAVGGGEQLQALEHRIGAVHRHGRPQAHPRLARRVKQRAAELDLEVVYVFIAPPSFEELERRLIGRGTETAEQQARRLETAKVELAAESEFDVTIVNETVDQAAADLWSVIAKEYGL